MGTATKTKTSSSTRTDIKYPDRFNVIIINDDYTPMEFVIQLLIEVFNKNIEEAKDITIQIHELGKGVAGTYNFEIAEQKVHESTLLSRHNGHPLNIMMEKV
jgi:ATP-dependent Clp protease adaptor protein ClpS